jgi:hypothetical protein
MTNRKRGVHRASNVIDGTVLYSLEIAYGIEACQGIYTCARQPGDPVMMSIGGHYVQN